MLLKHHIEYSIRSCCSDSKSLLQTVRTCSCIKASTIKEGPDARLHKHQVASTKLKFSVSGLFIIEIMTGINFNSIVNLNTWIYPNEYIVLNV